MALLKYNKSIRNQSSLKKRKQYKVILSLKLRILFSNSNKIN